ncbi:hypothetical protein OKW96_02400 [Sphingobacterium sp. KU25419]|nr:hypothetical protein OKW96_02400 [Sphingobacterium sp. KU25419]
MKITVLTGNSQDSTRISALSASVVNTNKTKIDSNYRSSIYTSLLLCSEINGFIENPNYYFTDNEEVKKIDLDNLMLIQGWRKLDWSMLDDSLNKPKYPIEKKHSHFRHSEETESKSSGATSDCYINSNLQYDCCH